MNVAQNVVQPVFRFNEYGRDKWVAARAVEIPLGARVLDLGAGPCRYARLFAHCRYVASDMTDVASAMRRVDVITDALRLPFPDEVFDVVLCTEVLEHVTEPIIAVAEAARVLRRGGRFLLTAPLGSGLHQMPFHYYGGFTPGWYFVFLPRAGFQHIEVHPNGGFFKHYGQESQRFHTMVDPRHVTGAPLLPRMAVAALWLLGFPWFRVAAPLLCHWLDPLDRHQEFTVGYHVTAVRA